MSLANPDEEIDEIITRKKSGKFGKIFSKTKKILIILIIGIIIGILFSYYFLGMITQDIETNQLKNCLKSNEILTIENQCLYTLIPNTNEIQNCSINKT
jgi:hypothetical protein